MKAGTEALLTFRIFTVLFVHKQLDCGPLKMIYSLRLTGDIIRSHEWDSAQRGEHWGWASGTSRTAAGGKRPK